MARSEAAAWFGRVEQALLVDGRYADLGIRFRIYDRDEAGEPRAAEWVGPVYGGFYDRQLRRYVGPPATVHEVSLTRATAPFVLDDDPEVIRQMLLGAPGAGKTFALVRRMLRRGLERPNSSWGGVGPTDERRRVVWDEFRGLVEPLGFVASALEKRREIRLLNGAIFQIVGAAGPSAQRGTAIQGKSWTEALVDEHQSITEKEHQEIDARGRRAGAKYRVSSTATNQTDIPEFAAELDRFEQNPRTHRIYRVPGLSNPFVAKSFYENLRSRYSPRDYEAIIEGKAVPPEHMVYHQYRPDRNLRRRPPDEYDITEQVLAKQRGAPWRYLGCQDFGPVVNATEIARCFRLPDGTRGWWIVDEIVTVRSLYQKHAREILTRYYADDILVIGDPHHNVPRREIDKSPFVIFRKEGLTCRPAVREGVIPVEHRIAMMNSLLCDANGDAHLFIDITDDGKPAAPRLHRAFLSEKRTKTGRPEGRKDLRYDESHYPTAVGYGLFPFEKIRATVAQQVRTIAGAVV